MLSKNLNDDAYMLNERAALGFFASKLAPAIEMHVQRYTSILTIKNVAMQFFEMYGKNSPPPGFWWQRSQGGVQFPTGGNCAQCA
ncbi:hypothetical protein GCM10009091_47360 [Pseudomonas brenneri]|uniref:Uncharacterized protein n=1 Tax=Pseudomonas brenneri TaxID=129817 RepID=A0ABY0WE63_9PSED|nr:hypothetical protein GCM10009091_47360 [Pseudomonas brenneri]SDV01427.1 hypothetical protein SAMN04490181_3054 [Pseudomonas brenneri]